MKGSKNKLAITLSSFISSSISITLLIGILFFVIHKQRIMSHFGLHLFSCFLMLFRGFFPIEFYAILTKSIYSYHFLPWLKDMVNMELFSVGVLTVTLMMLLYIVWVLGSLIYMYRHFRTYYLSKKYIASLPEVNDKEILETLHNVYANICPGKVCKIKVVYMDTILTPAIWGTLKPVILLPTFDYSKDEYHYIFMHEICRKS